MTWKLANAIGYQLVWLASIIGATHGSRFAGPLAAALFACLVLAFGGQRRADLRLIPLVLAIGVLVDSAWIALGWLDYSAPWPSADFAPAWILAIWLAFALTLNHSLAFLKRRHALASILGAIGGPLAYWLAADGFGAVHFIAPVPAVLIGLGVAWALMVPMLVRIADDAQVRETHAVAP
jgi:hypothetical protein